MDERVRQLQEMRRISLSEEERESTLTFLAGKEVPEGMGTASQQWLADELLTVMRLQETPWEGLADELVGNPKTQVILRKVAEKVVK